MNKNFIISLSTKRHSQNNQKIKINKKLQHIELFFMEFQNDKNCLINFYELPYVLAVLYSYIVRVM